MSIPHEVKVSAFERNKIRNFIASSKLDGVIFTEQEIARMTDKQIVEANVESRDLLIVGLNAIRVEAKAEPTVDEAVDHALSAAVLAVETAVLTGGVGTVVDLQTNLIAGWADAVNS